LIEGYRSGLEEAIARQIQDAGKPVIYEQDKITYIVPERQATYTPDFTLPKQNGYFYVETKGRWKVDDRQKHLLIKEQHPDIDIRFVFARDNKLYKGSSTSYSQYCDKHGFRYALKRIPDEWLQEGDNDNEPE
jgi:predicted nuclease of restriction endonuclease-like RecB superfamily